MLIYVLQWQPSWISDRHKKLIFCRGPSNDIQNGCYCRTWFNIGKMFQNTSSLKPLAQLKPNCPGMIIGRSSTKIIPGQFGFNCAREKKRFEIFFP
jgi:hypothetical protein